MTITNILGNYGFEARTARKQYWGCGSLMWGYEASVNSLGNDLYEVKYHHWYYNGMWDDTEIDSEEVVTLHGAQMLQYLFERLPLFRR